MNPCSGWRRAKLLGPQVLIDSVCLQPDVFPGNCWAFEGDQGQVVIRLPGRVQLTDITLQHPPPSVAHSRGANSAPRDFQVYVSGILKTGAPESSLAHLQNGDTTTCLSGLP